MYCLLRLVKFLSAVKGIFVSRDCSISFCVKCDMLDFDAA